MSLLTFKSYLKYWIYTFNKKLNNSIIDFKWEI